jgi:hypothetical protein
VPRRVNLPAADDLFRPTSSDPTAAPAERKVRAVPDAPEPPAPVEEAAPKKPSGRVRHDEKITVYVTSAELMEIEQTRLRLRGEHGLAVDRGRLVREAVGLVLAEFDEHGADSTLVRRLRE